MRNLQAILPIWQKKKIVPARKSKSSTTGAAEGSKQAEEATTLPTVVVGSDPLETAIKKKSSEVLALTDKDSLTKIPRKAI